MSDFAGMEELLQDFLLEAGELLSQVDNKLVDLEKRPDDRDLLNDIFRGFHTIKGGAGFLNVEHLVTLCHRTENLFDKLRNGELTLNPELMDVILAATGSVRDMFVHLSQGVQPGAADPALIASLEAALAGKLVPSKAAAPAPAPAPVAEVAPAVVAAPEPPAPAPAVAPASSSTIDDINWEVLHAVLTGGPIPQPAVAPAAVVAAPVAEETAAPAAVAEMAPPRPTAPEPTPQPAPQPQRAAPPPSAPPSLNPQKETTIRVDTARLDQVLNLSGEIGLTKNRISNLKSQVLHGKTDQETLKALDVAVSQLDLLVSDLQNAVMKTRMQPIGRLFQKYPRLARDLARQLGKDVELVLSGEETELDKTMIEDLNDPLVHLVRNAVDHGVETTEERLASNKPVKSIVTLSASQLGDHIYIEISDDGKGMRPDIIRSKAVQKGLIDNEIANSLDDRQSLHLIFMPGFSTKDEISSVSGRGVGMDVVRSNVEALGGRVEIASTPGEGTTFTMILPLTLAILDGMIVRLGGQRYVLPLANVIETVQPAPGQVKRTSPTNEVIDMRGQYLPVKRATDIFDLPGSNRTIEDSLVVIVESESAGHVGLIVDTIDDRREVVIKSLDQNLYPIRGLGGATILGDGSIALILDIEALVASNSFNRFTPKGIAA